MTEMRGSMSLEKNVQVVKEVIAAIGRCDNQGLLAICAENIQ